jgi:signal transduction histidine kinase
MTLQSFFQWFTQGAIVLVAILTVIRWLRWRDRASLDIVFVFATLAALTVMERVLDYMHVQPSWIGQLRISVLVAHPYLLLRVVSHFRPVSAFIRRFAPAGLVASLLAIWVPIKPFHTTGMAAFGFLYFIWLLGYVAFAFRQRSRSAGGVTHWRMLHASWGAGLLAVVFLMAVLINVVPETRNQLGALILVSALCAALNYYVAFAPPAWLRRVWQSAELYEFFAESSVGLQHRSREEVLGRLCQFVMSAVGARGAAVGLEDGEPGCLNVAVSYWDSLKTGSRVPQGRLLDAWTEGRAVFIKDYEPAGAPQALGAYGMPIPSKVGPRGMLIAVLPKGALFISDDLAMLRICCREAAVQLDNAAMTDRQQALIAELEQRTTQLATVNKELEAFSYSVSHDLRAPLRHISGFTDLLEKTNAGRMDQPGKRYLKLISDSAIKMGELIDALLVFSRMGRSEMLHSRVDLNAIVRTAQREAMLGNPARTIRWTIRPLPEVPGDPSMLQLVFTNLLSNAFKYTRDCGTAEVEIGTRDGTPEEAVIFVRDNGVGFDMAYADRLFGVFQRLHRAEEFEGTGIGLANVQRIVSRHGGRVWAEGELGKGATFYVALPKKGNDLPPRHEG